MFVTDLVTIKKDGLWVLREPLIWQTETERIEIPKDFATDLASIPRWLWRWWQPWGKWARAATLHDWTYLNPEGKTRWQCDWLFFQAMRSDGVELKTAVVFWLSCVLMGWRWFPI